MGALPRGVAEADGTVYVVENNRARAVDASPLLTYERAWWTGSDVVEAGWDHDDGSCGGMGQVGVARRPLEGACEVESWPLPLPCLESMRTVWTGEELLVFAGATSEACSIAGLDVPSCSVIASWQPEGSWTVLGATAESVHSVSWAADHVLLTTDVGQLFGVTTDGVVSPLGDLGTTPPAQVVFTGHDTVFLGAMEGYVVGANGQVSPLQPPLGGEPPTVSVRLEDIGGVLVEGFDLRVEVVDGNGVNLAAIDRVEWVQTQTGGQDDLVDYYESTLQTTSTPQSSSASTSRRTTRAPASFDIWELARHWHGK